MLAHDGKSLLAGPNTAHMLRSSQGTKLPIGLPGTYYSYVSAVCPLQRNYRFGVLNQSTQSRIHNAWDVLNNHIQMSQGLVLTE